MIMKSVLMMLRGLDKPASLLILSLCLSACAATAPVGYSEQTDAGGTNANEARSELAQIADVPAEAPDLSNDPAIFIGNDEGVKLPSARPPIRLDGEAVMLNFEQAPLNEVIHSILGETLGLDYVIENQVPGEITLRTRSPIPRDQLLPILESLLQNNNVLMIRGPNDRFFISASIFACPKSVRCGATR